MSFWLDGVKQQKTTSSLASVSLTVSAQKDTCTTHSKVCKRGDWYETINKGWFGVDLRALRELWAEDPVISHRQ